MITPVDSRVLDANTEALGIPVATLMDNAGTAIADFLKHNYPAHKILFVCGPGNNGGDGFAAALKLDPSQTKVALLRKVSEIHTDIARERYSLLECDISPYTPDCLLKCDVIVDCALGTGLIGSIREPYRSFIDEANTSGKTIISADIPSGFGTDLQIKPEHTITFHDVKTGMNESNSGKIHICDIGIPKEASTIVGPGDMLRYPIPKPDSHKGQNGKLMVIGGGPYFGAPIMSSLSALRIGTDLVRIFTPESSALPISISSPVLMVTSLKGDHLCQSDVDYLLKESDNFDSVLIGPGLGTNDETKTAIRDFVSKCNRPLVIDADGITAISDMQLPKGTIVTPHAREYSRLNPNDIDQIELSKSLNAIVLRKGKNDVISDGHRSRINNTGTPAMTGAGTGDVLSGAVASLLSKGMTPFDASCLGAYIVGKAGEYAFSERSYGMIATDVIDCIPRVLLDGLR